jgi:hypothetical protein
MNNFKLESVKENEMDTIELSEAEKQELAGGFFSPGSCTVSTPGTMKFLCETGGVTCG